MIDVKGLLIQWPKRDYIKSNIEITNISFYLIGIGYRIIPRISLFFLCKIAKLDST